MKKALKLIPAALLACAMLFNFTACSDDNDDENSSSGTPAVTLPESKGENPFAGKNFISSNKDGHTKEWNFGDKTLTYVKTYPKDGVKVTENYSYTYDADESLIYLGLTKNTIESEGEKTISYSSLSEYEALAKQYNATGAQLEAGKEEFTADFGITRIYKYTLNGDEAPEFKSYFDGKLPTYAVFYSDSSDYDVELYHGELEIDLNDSYVKYNCSRHHQGNLYNRRNRNFRLKDYPHIHRSTGRTGFIQRR